MPRLMPSARSTGNHYRNFAIGVLAVAALIAVATDGSSGEALAPAHSPGRPERAAAVDLPASGLAASHSEIAWASGNDETEAVAEMTGAAEDDEVAEEATPAAPPKAGKRGPADRPTPEQLSVLIAASRERSGAPPEGD